ncbi:MAG: cation transporter [Sphingobacteriaceae bacterium]|nr:cation transporter [Sphingobacteriaceae bacterium]
MTLDKKISQLFKLALGLAAFTIIYNIIEGLIATYIGFSDDSLTLFGFGADSFIETISGFGILHMVTRIQANPNSNRDNYERTALRITGFSFYTLVVGLLATSIYNFTTEQQPQTTFWGVIISVISIAIMLGLVYYKTKVGKALNSDAIIADAECTKVCIYMSVVLLLSSGIYHFTNLPYVDSVGALVLAYLSFKEGRECFEKAKSDKHCSCEHE